MRSHSGVAVGSASGLRAWVAAHGGGWLTQARLKALTVGLLVVAVLASGAALGGGG
jgi:hypothetical protein